MIEPLAVVSDPGLVHGYQAALTGWELTPALPVLFKRLFSVLFAVYLLARYVYRPAPAGSGSPVRPQSIQEKLISWMIVLLWTPAVIYSLTRWLEPFEITLPAWMRWVGAALFFAGDGLLFVSLRLLGSTPAGVLLTTGPYRLIRHPIYLAMFLTTTGMFLLSANLLVGLPYFAAVWIMYVIYVGPEEVGLLEAFGETYREYARRTGRLLPQASVRRN